jgi:futalosine hydrolase
MNDPMKAGLGTSRLLLFPTEGERRAFEREGGLEPGHALIEVCGFGVAASAARTAQLLGFLRPRQVLLVGIAGSFDEERRPVGSALAFSRVRIDGIGKGEGGDFSPPSALGIPQWNPPAGMEGSPIEEELPLLRPAGTEEAELLTVCSASATPEEAKRRRDRFPEAAAEEMEGFSVALACAMTATPLTILRGISNAVGSGDPKRWKIEPAIAAVRRLTIEVLRRDEWIEPS